MLARARTWTRYNTNLYLNNLLPLSCCPWVLNAGGWLQACLLPFPTGGPRIKSYVNHTYIEAAGEYGNTYGPQEFFARTQTPVKLTQVRKVVCQLFPFEGRSDNIRSMWTRVGTNYGLFRQVQTVKTVGDCHEGYRLPTHWLDSCRLYIVEYHCRHVCSCLFS